MVTKTPISVFCRIKPYLSKAQGDIQDYSINREHEKDTITISCQKLGIVNNRPDSYKFQFVKVFDQFVRQEDVYESVAKPVVQSALKGYNGTIFAYGQTGSGKTYTITGDMENKGIVPRALFDIFEAVDKTCNEKVEIHLSYMEIYNEHSNDLLMPNSERKKISLRENGDKVMQWHNLGICPVRCYDEAVELLAIGDSNRIVGDTPMNVFSSRSHTILTIYITAHIEEEFMVRKAKLNLVDLAGSERVHKTGEEGIVLEEARHINLSLHFLEQVIVALSDGTRKHVPYRNCAMTSALRDSLGGNCMTVMVANIAVDRSNLEETISTCRFSQRVALVRNELMINTVKDLSVENGKLKSEIDHLRKQCSALQAKLKILERKQNKQMNLGNSDDCNSYDANKQRSFQSDGLSVDRLKTDVVYLIGWLQDEHRYSNANVLGGGQGNTSGFVNLIDSEEKFCSFIDTLDDHAKDEWTNAKQTEEKTAKELSLKVSTIKDIHQEILEMWAISDYSLKQLRSSSSMTEFLSVSQSSTKDISAEHLFCTNSELLKDFQLLKYRLQSCKRNLERIKRKYTVEYNSWLKTALDEYDKNNKSKFEITHLGEDNGDVTMTGEPDSISEGKVIEQLTRKAIKSNSERNISNHMKNLAKYGSLLPNTRSFAVDDSDMNSTFEDFNESFLSSSTQISINTLDNSSTMPRAIRSAPSNLRETKPETPYFRYNPYTVTMEPIQSPLHRKSGDGQATHFQLTGDDEVDDEIITFYKNKLSHASSDQLGNPA